MPVLHGGVKNGILFLCCPWLNCKILEWISLIDCWLKIWIKMIWKIARGMWALFLLLFPCLVSACPLFQQGNYLQVSASLLSCAQAFCPYFKVGPKCHHTSTIYSCCLILAQLRWWPLIFFFGFCGHIPQKLSKNNVTKGKQIHFGKRWKDLFTPVVLTHLVHVFLQAMPEHFAKKLLPWVTESAEHHKGVPRIYKLVQNI